MIFFSALLDQARFKPEELKLAEKEDVFSRFIISPKRSGPGNELAETYPIACGVLGGFGGFLQKSFRRHDYLLGRRNAQSFLRWSFGLPETNEAVFGGFAGDRDKWRIRDIKSAKDTRSFRYGEDQDLGFAKFSTAENVSPDTPGLPIIPLVPALCEPIRIEERDLPQPYNIALDELQSLISRRAEKVVTSFVRFELDLKEAAKTEELPAGPAKPAAKEKSEQLDRLSRIAAWIKEAGGDIKQRGEEFVSVPLRWAATKYGTRVITKIAVKSIAKARNQVEGAFRR